MTRSALLALAVLAFACGPAVTATHSETQAGQTAGRPASGDAPYDPASDSDLEEMRGRYDAMAPLDPGRVPLRGTLAEEYARRIDRALGDPDRHYLAYEHLLALLSLWSHDELAKRPAELAAYAPQARAVRAAFARSAGDVESTAALLFLALAEPAGAVEHLAELDDIFRFADELAVAEHGDGAQHSRPIHILEEIIEVAQVPEALRRLMALYQARQRVLAGRFRDQGPSAGLLRAHGDGAFRTTWYVIWALARAGRLDDAPKVLDPLDGLGVDPRLRAKLDAALAPKANAAAWLTLAEVYAEKKPKESEDSQARKARAVLAITLEGARRLAGKDNEKDRAALLLKAGETARHLDAHYLALSLYEQAFAADKESREAAEELADLYRIELSSLAHSERPNAARAVLGKLEKFHAEAAQRWPQSSSQGSSKTSFESELAEAYAAMGSGMTSLGQLEEAGMYFRKSLKIQPTFTAFEQLGTIALKQDRIAEAVDYFDRALKLPVDSPIALYSRAKILRLAGDAAALHSDSLRAQNFWAEAISTWMELGEKVELPPQYKAQLLVESGKAQWKLGDQDTAILAFETAVDIDSDGDDTFSSVISYLIVNGQYDRALDAYYRALGSHDVSDYSKVYLSLWVVAEARRLGRPADPLAKEYLQSRKGTLWHHDLARYATGQEQLKDLEARATTRARRAELLYYMAVLGSAMDAKRIQRLLRDVVATNMVLFYEYDMAKHWLTQGFTPARASAKR